MLWGILLLLLACAGWAQEPATGQFDPDPAKRLAAVESIIENGGSRAAEQLRVSCSDGSGEVQRLAVAGIVNFYLPGYVRKGVRARLSKLGDKIARSDDEWLIDPWVQVRSEDAEAILGVLRAPKSDPAKLEAARALGILRYRQALPDLYPLLKTKNDDLMSAALRAIETSGDKAAAQESVFLIRDLNEKIHLKVMALNGIFRNEAALSELAEVFARSRSAKSRAGALQAVALIGSPESKGLFSQNLRHKEASLRGYAAEGLGRANAVDKKAEISEIFSQESSPRARLGQAFALVRLGDYSEGELSPMTYLFNSLNSVAWKGVAAPYLEDLAQDPAFLPVLTRRIPDATNDEKIGLAGILAAKGGRAEKSALEALANDKDPKVAQEGIKAAKALAARLP